MTTRRGSAAWIRSLTAGLPRSLTVGLTILAAGLVLDLVFHLVGGAPAETGGHHGAHETGSAMELIHAIAFAGMGLSLLGLFSAAFRTPARPHTHRDPGRSSS